MLKTTLAACLVFAVGLSAASAASVAPVTFNKEVAPIIFKNCAACHRPGEVAPMSLMTYKDARPWGKSIREKVTERIMPPWHADPKVGHFQNDRRLSQKDIDTLVAWVDGGLKEGDAKDLPPAPTFEPGWNIGKPDVTFSLPKEYSVPAQGVVAYQTFTVDTNFTEDHWIQAAEIRPGNTAVVHHVIVYVQEPPDSPRAPAGAQIRMPGQAEQAQGAAPVNPRGANRWFMVGRAPGVPPLVFPESRGKLIKAGSKLFFQMHYTPNGTAATDRTTVGFVFAKHAPEFEVKTLGVANPRFEIPAGDANYKVESLAVFTEDSHLWSFLPHAHLRGKDFTYRMVYPDGRIQELLNVPHYDFNWQTSYVLTEPLAVPKGSRLEVTAHYDNSTANRFNPDPTKAVRWGDQTWEEMMMAYVDYSTDNQKVSSESATAQLKKDK